MQTLLFHLGHATDIAKAEILSFFPDAEWFFFLEKDMLVCHVSEAPNWAQTPFGSVRSVSLLRAENQNLETLVTETNARDVGISFVGDWTGKERSIMVKRLSAEKKEKSLKIRLLFPQRDDAHISGAVLHHQLVGKKRGLHIFLSPEWELFETVWHQNIRLFASIDFDEEKKADGFNGLMPPKLAQTLVNFAMNECETEWVEDCILCDPFCGDGNIALVGLATRPVFFDCSDINPIIVENAAHNLKRFSSERYTISDADAVVRQYTGIDAIVTEWYLGHPWKRLPKPEIWKQEFQNIFALYRAFLERVAESTVSVVVLCFPAYQTAPGEFYTLEKPFFELLKTLPFERVTLGDQKQLIYARPQQSVGRHIFCLRRKEEETQKTTTSKR